MRVLWVCNTILPDFLDMFNLNLPDMGGWMTGLLHELEKEDDIQIGLAFPLIDERRRKNGEKNNHKIYAYNGAADRQIYTEESSEEFVRIIKDFEPDIIHMFGTEYNHAMAVVTACKELDMIDNLLVDIQGLTSYIAIHFLNGIPENVLDESYSDGRTIRDYQKHFEEQGKLEDQIWPDVRNVTGRTFWDRACVLNKNPNLKYYKNHRALRESFYSEEYKWNYEKCTKHSILLSNGSYPLKGFHMVIPAIKHLAEKYPDLSVNVAGPDPRVPDSHGEITQYGNYIARLMDEYELEDVVSFLGVLNEKEMARAFQKTHVFLAPSTIENSCNSLCEAMILGVPSVAAYSGGIPELIKHGEDGFLYQQDAYYIASYNIMRLFEDEKLTYRVSEKSKEAARIRHDKDFITKNTIEEYYEIKK